jgi:hypothetical protein
VKALLTAVTQDVVRDLLDEDGRPLGENASPKYPKDMTREVTCPYSGTRHGGVMNVSALAQITENWSQVLGALRSEGTVLSAWRATVAGITAPVRYALDHPGEPVPRSLSALYKTCLGFNQVLLHVLLSGDVARRPLSDLGDADSFLDLLEAGGFLVGGEQVCAGPPQMLRAAFDALGATGEPVPDPTVDAVCRHMLVLVKQAIVSPPTSGPAWIRTAILVPRQVADVDRIEACMS